MNDRNKEFRVNPYAGRNTWPKPTGDSLTMVKLYNAWRPNPSWFNPFKYRCEICNEYFSHAKHFVDMHKLNEHKDKPDKKPVDSEEMPKSERYLDSKVSYPSRRRKTSTKK